MDYQTEILRLVKEANPDNPMAFVSHIVKDYAHEKLCEHILSCSDCNEEITSKSLPTGNANASVLIIGECAPYEEYKKGIVPNYGSQEMAILNKIFEDFKINPEELYFINAIQCWPNRKGVKRTPNAKEISNCSVFIEYAIQTVKPLMIILLGGVALNLFKKDTVTNARGKWLDVHGIPAMITYHPSYFLKIEGKKPEEVIVSQKFEFYNDMKLAFDFMAKKYPENNLFLKSKE